MLPEMSGRPLRADVAAHAAYHVVVSRPLKDASWGKSTIWRDIDPKAVEALKAGGGKSILMFGGASVVGN